jgi:hypothetical protein
VVRVKTKLILKARKTAARRAWGHHALKRRARIFAHAVAGSIVCHVALPHVLTPGYSCVRIASESAASTPVAFARLRVLKRIAELYRRRVAQGEERRAYSRGLGLSVGSTVL